MMVDSTDEINMTLHLAHQVAMTVLFKALLVVNMPKNKMELRAELVDYDQDQH